MKLPDRSSKLYSFKTSGGKEEKKCKGIKKNVVKKTISHEDYKRCLFSKEKQLRRMNVIRSENHDIYTQEMNKVALSAQDDKRYVLEDGIHTLALNHFKIKNCQE